MMWLFERGARAGMVSTPEGYAELARLAARHVPQETARNAVALSQSEAAAVIKFWVESGPQEWFGKRPDFDRRFRERFLSLHETVAREHGARPASPDESLALLLLLDQFPRNAFRGSPRMYATDDMARAVADAALRSGHDRVFDPDLRVFFYLPFAHSERLDDQERSVELAQPLPKPAPSHAKRHRDIIGRFGRFPHRNAILGRAMRPEEQQFLDEGGFSG